MTPVIDFSASRRFLRLKLKFQSFCSVEISVDGNHWTEGLELIHCSTLSGSSGPLSVWFTFLLWLPHRVMWFPSREHVCQSTGIWAQVVWFSPCPYPGPSLALGVVPVTIHLLSLSTCVFHMFIIPTVPVQGVR